MSDRQLQEKSEKDEKDREKHDEKTMEEKWRRDPLGQILWAAIFIWAGLVFLAYNLGMFQFMTSRFLPGFPFIVQPDVWSIIFLGAGVIVLIGVAIRLAIPAYRQPISGSIVLGLFLIAVGLGNLFGWNLVWPFILIALGLSFLLRNIGRRP